MRSDILARSQPYCRMSRVTALCGALLLLNCGSHDASGPSDARKPGGTMTGQYTLELISSPACGGRSVIFPVEVVQTGSSPHPGVQMLIAGDSSARFEIELQYTNNTLVGGVGTWGDGQPTSQGTWIWINAIAEGPTTADASGRGEVLSGGTMRGYFEIEGVMNACVATNHSFTLKAQ